MDNQLDIQRSEKRALTEVSAYCFLSSQFLNPLFV